MILIQPNRKFLLFCFFIVIIPVRSFAQEREILLIANFDNWVSIAFDLNNIAVGYGDNRWTINKSYSGAGGHPNTPAQDITYSGGKIGGEGNYLHINDLPSSSLNASFNPNNNSERWAVMQWGICTHGFDKIEVNFWFVADGSNNAYGEVYYSIDSGATWVLTTNTEGFAKYKGYDKWKEITIQEPAFINHVDLRIGYKWTNIGASSTDELPFSVDDIMILGYTSPTPSIVLTVDSISADTLCQEEEGGFKVYFSTSDSICPYELLVLELSDSNGSFTDAKILTAYGNPTANAFFSPSPINPGTKWITPPMGPIHSDVPKGSCYKIRIRMLSPPYAISNPYSGCVNIIDCTDSIETLQPAVLNDTSMLSNHICIYSVIDVPFYSYGGYNPGNKYVLELSDSSGGFSNSIVISDSVSSTTTFNPIIYPAPNSPGMIKGKIPYMPTGCNYYVRVVATDPNVPDSNIVSYGPFCIDACDIVINNGEDVSIASCTSNFDTIVPLDIHFWDDSSWYAPIVYNIGNEFKVQIIDPDYSPVQIINTGGLGLVADTSANQIKLTVPDLAGYLAMGLIPGKTYYLRVISTNNQTLGSLIRFNASMISGKSLTITGPTNPVSCFDALVFDVNPKQSTSEYVWIFASAGITKAIPANQHPIAISGAIFSSGTHYVTVHEVNGSCTGVVSDSFSFVKVGPAAFIFGDSLPSQGDTVKYWVDNSPTTIYEWEYDKGILIDSNNYSITLVWPTMDTGYVKVWAFHGCGLDSNMKQVIVGPPPSGTEKIINTQHVLIYPNPTQDHITVLFPGISGNVMSISVYNILGEQVLYDGEIISHPGYYKDISLEKLPAGIYVLKVVVDDNILVGKVIKN